MKTNRANTIQHCRKQKKMMKTQHIQHRRIRRVEHVRRCIEYVYSEKVSEIINRPNHLRNKTKNSLSSDQKLASQQKCKTKNKTRVITKPQQTRELIIGV